MLAAHRTADGYRIIAQVPVDSKALLRALKKPDLSGLSYQLNGVSEHVLMARSLIVPREVDLPSMASDPKSAKLVAPRATLIRDRWMETSISMVGSPEMIVRTEFRAAIFGDEFLLLNANSRNAFERNIAEPVERVAYNWSGFTDNGIDFVKKEGSKKVHKLSERGQIAHQCNRLAVALSILGFGLLAIFPPGVTFGWTLLPSVTTGDLEGKCDADAGAGASHRAVTHGCSHPIR